MIELEYHHFAILYKLMVYVYVRVFVCVYLSAWKKSWMIDLSKSLKETAGYTPNFRIYPQLNIGKS